MRDPLNIDQLVSLLPDYIGFIFYSRSPRYIKDLTNGAALSFISPKIKRTGVFVNSDEVYIRKMISEFNLSAIQLHGDEEPEFCKQFQNDNIEIIKAFHVDDAFHFDAVSKYSAYCDYYLFDTKTASYGGSGKKFNWQKINEYKESKPFFLSGGIGIEDMENVKRIDHPALYAIDINSRFEISPGLKNIEEIKKFILSIRNIN